MAFPRIFRYLLLSTLSMASVPASAVVVLQGNYIRVGISDYGTLGSNGATSPGLIHDPSGTANFVPSTDYITPGIPHEGFSINSKVSGFQQNDNNSTRAFNTVTAPTLLTGAAALGFDNAATWTGQNDFARITNSYFFNAGDERINILTTITALTDLNNLAFARSVDPDSGGTTSINQRGNSLFGPNDFIGSASATNGRTLALVNLNGDSLTHATQINSSCCSNIDPYTVLASPGLGNSATGDYGLNLAYSIGNLAAGSSVLLNYAYAVGTRIDTVGTPGGSSPPPTGAVPEPATWATMLLGFAIVGQAMRRARATPKVVTAAA